MGQSDCEQKEEVAPATPALYGPGVYLAGLRRELPHADRPLEVSDPLFNGTLDSFREQHAGDKWLLSTLTNTTRRCPKCNKSNGTTVPVCNNCAGSLEGVAIARSDNVFMAFVYGIARGLKTSYTLAIRAQTPDLLCFDDLLSMSVMHFNAVPTSVHLPDIRFLFADPARGLELVNSMFECAAKVALEQFWSNEAIRKKFFKGEPPPPSPDAMLGLVMAFFNHPPSMFQLHLQFVHLPLLPHHFSMMLEDAHFRKGRCYPLEYVRAGLQLGDAARIAVTEQTSMDEIVARLDALGLSYDAAHTAAREKCCRGQARYSWDVEDFKYRVVGDKVLSTEAHEEVQGQDALWIREVDKLMLKSYGRPFDAEGKPSATYYRFAKRPGEVLPFA